MAVGLQQVPTISAVESAMSPFRSQGGTSAYSQNTAGILAISSTFDFRDEQQ